ncbi:hypothetical protein ACFSC6_02830 [Rufibacter sediminis]|uniref:DUF3997 domain-containing protein n=1 Tax=Rufibacter sediminis TaxID=2762756 RepID=A0ABR6VSY9_9BACT|nr:hypothetical protein [Rufibacter sediminis]MBC3540320.1 hypothetical protein [Rufibacter sediminis]
MFNQLKPAQTFRRISVLLILTSSYSCRFAYKEHVIGKYFIIGVDTKDDLSLSYKLSNGDFVGKAPGQILQYGYNDTVIVAKTQNNYNGQPSYYIINMVKDSDYAHEEDFQTGPIAEEEFNTKWKQKVNINLVDVQ